MIVYKQILIFIGFISKFNSTFQENKTIRSHYNAFTHSEDDNWIKHPNYPISKRIFQLYISIFVWKLYGKKIQLGVRYKDIKFSTMV